MEGLSEPAGWGVFIVALLVGVACHEAMHALTSHLLGDDTAKEQGRITLNPLAHVDPFMTLILPTVSYILFGWLIAAAKPVMINPRNLRWGEYGMALVALAGPLTNLVLALAASLGLHLLSLNLLWQDVLVLFIQVNVVFFAFNMLPIPPLDGSRVLYVFAPDGLRQMMDFIERFGFMLLIVLILLFYQYIGAFIEWVYGFVINFWG